MFALIVKLRNILFDQGWMTQFHAQQPVISIGNISSGGTGKTPCTIMIARLLNQMNVQASLLSSGYKRTGFGEMIIMQEYSMIADITPEMVGDEVYLHAMSGLYHTVISNQPKYKSISSFSTPIIIDDGFQHRSIARDLDIVLINKKDLLDRILPFGRLREPLESLQRAHVIMCTDDTPEVDIRQYMSPDALFLRIAFHIDIPYFMNKQVVPDSYRIHSIMAVAGIANPQRFSDTLTSNGFTVRHSHWFKDHFTYTEEHVHALCTEASKHQCKVIAITEKDYVKLHSFEYVFTKHGIEVLVIPIISHILEGKKELQDYLFSICSQKAINQ